MSRRVESSSVASCVPGWRSTGAWASEAGMSEGRSGRVFGRGAGQ